MIHGLLKPLYDRLGLVGRAALAGAMGAVLSCSIILNMKPQGERVLPVQYGVAYAAAVACGFAALVIVFHLLHAAYRKPGVRLVVRAVITVMALMVVVANAALLAWFLMELSGR
jgi:hypothetical protein